MKEVHPRARIENVMSLYWLAQAAVFQKILSNSSVMGSNLRGAVCLAGMGETTAVLGRMMVSDRPKNVLRNALLQSFECTSYVPAVAVAHKLIHDIIVLMDR